MYQTMKVGCLCLIYFVLFFFLGATYSQASSTIRDPQQRRAQHLLSSAFGMSNEDIEDDEILELARLLDSCRELSCSKKYDDLRTSKKPSSKVVRKEVFGFAHLRYYRKNSNVTSTILLLPLNREISLVRIFALRSGPPWSTCDGILKLSMHVRNEFTISTLKDKIVFKVLVSGAGSRIRVTPVQPDLTYSFCGIEVPLAGDYRG